MSDKQPEALRLSNTARDAQLDPMLAGHAEVSKVFLLHVEAELRRLHALCEEQMRLLEQAREALEDKGDYSIIERAKAHTAITNHLRQHEGEKHD